MESYRLFIKPSAAKELAALPTRDRKRLANRIARLAAEPRPPGVEKLSGQEKYRVRQGDYRVVYAIDDSDAAIVVVKIGHRREIYR